jgi:dephospho-CoA kinase
MMVIGITGGMASGKSTLAHMFAGRGILHIDADQVVHRLMREDRATIAAIGGKFPKAVKDGHIDRAALAEAIGKNQKALAALEHILHPRVRAVEVGAIDRARRHRLRAVILDIPLLFETDAQVLCDVVIVAHAPLSLRRRRAFARRGMTDVKWEKLIARQLPDHLRRRAADIVIPTGLGKATTRRVVERLMRRWGLN